MSDSEFTIVPKRRRREVSSPFPDLVDFQKKAFELVVYCAEAKQVVTIAWPLSPSGQKIVPAGIRDWLRARNIHWACFCGLAAPSGVHLSCRIVVSSTRTYAYCQSDPSTCGFYMNLTDIYNATTMTSSYRQIEIAQGNSVFEPFEPIVTAEMVANLVVTSFGVDMAPYFKGYAGSRIRGVVQRAGEPKPPGRFSLGATRIRYRQPRQSLPITLQEYQYTPAVVNQAVAGPGPSTMAHRGAVEEKSELEKQRDILVQLGDGQGISAYDWAGLVEECNLCMRHFLSTFIKEHIRACADGSVASDEGSD